MILRSVDPLALKDFLASDHQASLLRISHFEMQGSADIFTRPV